MNGGAVTLESNIARSGVKKKDLCHLWARDRVVFVFHADVDREELLVHHLF